MDRDVLYTNIMDVLKNDKDDDYSINEKYSKINKVIVPVYDFVLSYGNSFNERKFYGSGPKLTLVEVHILTQIYDNPGITVTELSKVWNRTTSAISQTVRKLMKQNLVFRKNSTTDGKVFHLYTSEEGKKVAMGHKRYDTEHVVSFGKLLIEKFSIDDLIKFSEISEEANKLLIEYMEKSKEK